MSHVPSIFRSPLHHLAHGRSASPVSSVHRSPRRPPFSLPACRAPSLTIRTPMKPCRSTAVCRIDFPCGADPRCHRCLHSFFPILTLFTRSPTLPPISSTTRLIII